MSKQRIIYQENQEVIGIHLRSKEWVMYKGNLTIYDKKLDPIVLKLKSEIQDSFIGQFMEETIQFKGDSLAEVFGKVAKWYYKNGIIFQD